MDTKSLAHPAHPIPEETRERGRCSGCGTTGKTLTAPIPNARDYTGPMYCLSCNPRFFTLDMHFSLAAGVLSVAPVLVYYFLFV